MMRTQRKESGSYLGSYSNASVLNNHISQPTSVYYAHGKCNLLKLRIQYLVFATANGDIVSVVDRLKKLQRQMIYASMLTAVTCF